MWKKKLFQYLPYGLIIWLMIMAILLSFLLIEDKKVVNKIYPHVFINNVNVGSKTKQEAEQLFQKNNAKLKNVQLTILYKNQSIATFSAEQLNLRVNSQEVVDQAYLVGRSKHTPSRLQQKFLSLTRLREYHFPVRVIYNQAELKDFIDTVEESYNLPAKDALFTFENGKVTNFKPHENGLAINSQKFISDFESVINDLNTTVKSRNIVLTDTVKKPKVTLAQANNLGIEELIGEGKSDYTHSIPNRVFNVLHAAKRFNGIVIPKGEEFSFNKYVGDISAASGFQQAYVIQNGKTVLGDGGGVCQVSTTAFRAALNSGLPIVERHAHAYRVGYYENDSKPGLDATIYTPSVDFRFKNDTQAAILVQTSADEENNLLYFRFYGKKDDRKVELSPITIWDVVAAPPPVYQDDPSLPKGTTKQVDFAAVGTKSKFTYKVTKDGKLTEKEFISIYRPWAAVFLVGTM